jgi:ParB family transcriptional regulator, chromosome partitioning protein
MKTAKKVGLGRGFEGLIPTGMNVESIATPGEQIKQLSIDSLQPNPRQPRKHFDEHSLQELAESIKNHGIIQPLVVTPAGDNKYRIVAGERRFRAAKISGLKKVPVIVRNHKELEELEIALVENVQRVDLSPIEQAVSIVRLRDQFSLTPKDIAKKLGKAETTISNIVRLLQLPPEAIYALQENTISEGHARAILALKTDDNLQKELLNKIITQNISVRDAEEFVKQNRTQQSTTVTVPINILKQYPNSVKVQTRKDGSGTLNISFKSKQQLEYIYKKLS